MAKSSDIVWHDHTVSREDRQRRLGQRGLVVWFTGLSGCGKSTIANELDRQLCELGRATILLDGDNIRHGLVVPPRTGWRTSIHRSSPTDLGLDLARSIARRISGGLVRSLRLMASAGLITLTAFVSPYRRDRDRVRKIVEDAGSAGDFIEVFVDTPLEVCESRDPKGLYKKARAGEIKNFTGISDPYEAPENPEIHLRGGDDRTPAEQAAEVLDELKSRGAWS